jgi:hypothetical protein
MNLKDISCNTTFKWQYEGYDDGKNIMVTHNEWKDLVEYRSNVLEEAYSKGIKSTSTNGGEYQFNLETMKMTIIDFGYCSPDIKIRRVNS